MRWTAGTGSNVEDVRGRSGGGGFGIPLGIGGVLILLVGSWLTGVNLFSLVGGGTSSTTDTSVSQPASSTPQEDKMMVFVDAVMGDIQNSWQQRLGARYQPTKVRVFRDEVQSACGLAGAATGPFYCPGDSRVYLDLGFFDELQRRFKAPGDFAQAYVIAHEVGHHVQNLLGVLPKAQEAQQAAGSKAAANRIQVRVELQADCLAGVWANRSNQKWKTLEPGDVEAALQTASAIGDDRLQKQSRGYVVPDAFTHGSSAQRQHWFSTGLKEGNIAACNTFSANAQL